MPRTRRHRSTRRSNKTLYRKRRGGTSKAHKPRKPSTPGKSYPKNTSFPYDDYREMNMMNRAHAEERATSSAQKQINNWYKNFGNNK
jgi:hypothetical protein